MTNELIAKIQAEIERRIKELDEQIVDIYDSKAVLRKDELQKLLFFLFDFEKSLPTKVTDGEELEKEVHSYLKIHHLHIKDGGRVVFCF